MTITQAYLLKDKATQHLKNKKYSSAAVYLRDILKLLPPILQNMTQQNQIESILLNLKIPTHKNLSLCSLKLNLYAQCLDHCQPVLQIEPNCSKMLYRAGQAYLGLRQLDKAKQYLEKGYLQDPNEVQFAKALAKLQAERNLQNSKLKNKNGQTLNPELSLKNLLALLFWPLFFILKWVQDHILHSQSLIKRSK